MRLERIELIGFKSFSDRTVLDFHPGITAIVGPNGCGKSNVVDAFKWVLGEQSAKSLRGDSMEDVIFFGSANKKARGMAEVSLVISDLNWVNPSDDGNSNNSEVSITRRIYRSGESEYLINKVPCRLKDIRNLFLDTGLDVRSYSIFEQSRMNSILNSKPEERRFLIEEVAGVMKYKVRRTEALQKLEASRYNLQRLQDIIGEVKRQINSIERYVKKAEKYKRLLEEIRDIETRISRREIKRLTEEGNNLSSMINGMRLKEAEVSTRIQSINSSIEQKKTRLIEQEKALEELRRRQHDAEKTVTEIEGRLALLKREHENLKDRSEELKKRESDLLIEREVAIKEASRIEDEISKIEHEVHTLQVSLKEREGLIKGLEDEIIEHSNLLDNERRALFNKAEEGSILRNEIKHLSMIMEDIDKKMTKLLEERKTTEEGFSGIRDELKRRDDERLTIESTLTDKKREKESLYEELKRKRDELRSIEDNLYKKREELAALNSRYESLKELYTAKRIDIGDNARFLCQVADILDTRPEYESAIEAVLGDKLSAIVVESNDDIMTALRHVKEHNTRRSGFISLNPLRPGPFSSYPAGNDQGVIGCAIDLIKTKDGFSSVVEALLGDVLVVKDIDTAFSIRERLNGHPVYLVTLDAEVIEPSGMVYGGIERGLLQIRRQLKEIERDIGLCMQEIADSEVSIAGLQEGIKTLEQRLFIIGSEIADGERRYHEIGLQIGNLNEESDRYQKRLQYLDVEIENEEKEGKDIRALMDEKEKRYKEIEMERTGIEARLKEIQEIIVTRKRSLEDARSRHTEIKLQITSMNERMKALQKEVERLRTDISSYENKRSSILLEHLSIEEGIRNKQSEIKEKEDEIRSSVLLTKGLGEEIRSINGGIESLSNELSAYEEEQKTLTSEFNRIRDELAQTEMKMMEVTLRLNYIKDDIRKTYGISIDTVDEDVDVSPEEEERLPHLKERIQEMGAVNLGTLEEYEELKTRYNFLEKQQNDLLDSIATLEETIRRINKSTSQRLTDAFNSLNEKFKEVFTMLFGGGKAELILTGSDILESGIDIVAQPPGKRLKNLAALSGGEQALTTLSLLFAGFMVKPTPMCIMDEVDAPLDESNIDRFTKMLSELSRDVQFIIITHNRVTTSVADYIYGITMEEPGVSKVVSMHLTGLDSTGPSQHLP